MAKYLGYTIVPRVVGPGTKPGTDAIVYGYRCRNARCKEGRWHGNIGATARCGQREDAVPALTAALRAERKRGKAGA